MLPRTKKLLALLIRPGLHDVVLLLARGPIDEKSVGKNLGVSQSTANRALRDLEIWGLATNDASRSSQGRGRKKRLWRLTTHEVVGFLDSADFLTTALLEQQLQEAETTKDQHRQSRVNDTSNRSDG